MAGVNSQAYERGAQVQVLLKHSCRNRHKVQACEQALHAQEPVLAPGLLLVVDHQDLESCWFRPLRCFAQDGEDTENMMTTKKLQKLMFDWGHSCSQRQDDNLQNLGTVHQDA